MPKKAKAKIKKEKKPSSVQKSKKQKTRQPKKTKISEKEEQIIKKEEIISPRIIAEVGVERDKKFILWSGVVFFMALFFIFWIFNIKNILKIEQSRQYEDFDFKNVSDGFSESIGQMKEDLAEIKNFASSETRGEVSTSTPEKEVSQRDIFELKGRLEELEGKIGTSTEENDVLLKKQINNDF